MALKFLLSFVTLFVFSYTISINTPTSYRGGKGYKIWSDMAAYSLLAILFSAIWLIWEKL